MRRLPRAGLVRLALFALLAAGIAGGAALGAPAPQGTANLVQELRSFREMGTVLYLAAHPDDENTQLITYFSRGRGYRTGYLSLTRGDGGQNELGPEFGERLGLVRTQELLAARRVDGGRQFFSRAIDFGYSKSPEETLRFWDHDQVLADVVRVIRQFRPDVIITRFPIPPGSGGHGHHTASAMLAVAAFKVAGDPAAFPDQLKEGLAPWQPKRIVWNEFGQNRGANGLTGPSVQLDIGGNDAVTGEAFGTIANRSRGMHKTQGLGVFSAQTASGPNVQSFMLLAGDSPAKDLLDGVDTTWNRVPGGAEIGPLAEAALAQFQADNPAAIVPALLAIRAKLAALPADPLVDDKRTQLDRILQACLGLSVETTVAHADVVPGETFKLQQVALVRSDFPVRWLGARYDGAKPLSDRDAIALVHDKTAARESAATLRADTSLSQPYWLREEPTTGVFTINEPRLIGRPENPPVFPVDQVFEVGGQTLIIASNPVEVATTAGAETRRQLVVVGPVSLEWIRGLELVPPGTTQTFVLELTANRANVSGRLEFQVSPGWTLKDSASEFHLAAAGDLARVAVVVTAPPRPSSARISVLATVGARHYHRSRTEIRYEHIPPQILQPDAVLKVVALDVDVRAKKVGYLPGAGDDIAASLRQLGCEVTELTGMDLTAEKLHGLDAVVIGVRAFNERADLAANLPGLFAYVEAGGTVIAQYNRPNNLKAPDLGPYKLSIEGPAPALRVTDETAAVTFLAPDHPALNRPNKIGPADFDGWVQERGAYFPSSWDEQHYTTVLAMNDPGEAPLRSGLLVARHGQGYFVYTGLSFFRQLPAGVPGAYRLFANLLSLGK